MTTPAEITPPASPAPPVAGGTPAPATEPAKPGEVAPGGTPPPASPPPAAATPAPAADFELKAPEGLQADAALKEFKELAKAEGIKAEAAQKTVDVFTRHLLAENEKTIKGWAETCRKDPELGGASYDANLQTAKKALAKYGSPALTEWLTATGAEAHPELFRMLMKVGKDLAEDTVVPVAGPGSSVAVGDRKALYRQQYPNTPSLWSD